MKIRLNCQRSRAGRVSGQVLAMPLRKKTGITEEETGMNRYRFKGMPLETEFRLRKGRELVRKGNDRDALAYFRQAAFIAPDPSVAFREIANCLSRLGRSDEAERYYGK